MQAIVYSRPLRGRLSTTPDRQCWADKMKKIWIPQTVAGVMLAWALNPANPYGYYMLLRIVCCAVCVYLAIAAGNIGKTQWAWTLGVFAVIYNPIIRIHLTREIWSVVNVVTIVVLAVSVAQLERKGK